MRGGVGVGGGVGGVDVVAGGVEDSASAAHAPMNGPGSNRPVSGSTVISADTVPAARPIAFINPPGQIVNCHGSDVNAVFRRIFSFPLLWLTNDTPRVGQNGLAAVGLAIYVIERVGC